MELKQKLELEQLLREFREEIKGSEYLLNEYAKLTKQGYSEWGAISTLFFSR